MLHNRIGSTLLATVGFALVLGTSNVAEARRGIMIINTGEDVMEIAEIPAAIQAELDLPPGSGPLKVGVKYSRFGVFWLDIVRWDSELCVFNETADGFSYEVGTVADLAEIAGIPESEVKKPTRYYLPPGGVILGLIVVVGAPVLLLSGAADKKRRAALMADSRYAAVVQQFHANPGETHEARMQQAVIALSQQGVPTQQALDDLRFLLGSGDEES